MTDPIEITDLEQVKAELFITEQKITKAKENILPDYVKCPKCSSNFINRQIKFTSIEECTNCKGIWLDYGELTSLLRLETKSIEKLEIKTQIDDTSLEDELLDFNDVIKNTCPRCNRGLKEISIKRDPSIKIDTCPSCKGSFYDHGELTKCLTLLKY